MNRINNKTKMVLVAIIMLVAAIFLFSKNSNKNKIPINPVVENKDVLMDNKSPGQISWQLTENKLETEAKVYKASVQYDPDNYFLEVSKSLGINEEPNIRNEKLIVINSQDNRSAYLDKIGNKIGYTLDLYKSKIGYNDIRVNTDFLRQAFLDLLSTTFKIEPSKIRVEKMDYQEIEGPRYISTTADKASVVEFLANYQLDGFPIYTPTGNPVSVRYSTNGTLLKIEIVLPNNYQSTGQKHGLKQLEDIKQIPANKFKILTIDGGKTIDMAEFDENVVQQVVIKEAKLGYIELPNQLYLLPYFIFQGNGLLNTGPANITLAIPALEENQ